MATEIIIPGNWYQARVVPGICLSTKNWLVQVGVSSTIAVIAGRGSGTCI